MDEILKDNPVKDFQHFISFELIIINQIPQDTDAYIIFWLNPQVTHFIMTLCWRNHSWEDVIVTVVSQNIFYAISHYNKSKLKRRWRPSWTRDHFKRASLNENKTLIHITLTFLLNLAKTLLQDDAQSQPSNTSDYFW